MTVAIVADDPFGNVHDISSIPGNGGVALTKSDTDDLVHSSRGIYVGVAGDLTVNFANNIGGGTGVLLKAVPVGYYPFRISRLWSTGTTATNVVALY